MEIEQQENNRFYHLSFWWFFLVSVAVGVLTEGIAFFEGWGVWFETWGYFLMCGIAFLLCLSYCLFAHFLFHVKPAWVFLALFLLLFAGNTVAILCFPETSILSSSSNPSKETIYVLGGIDRVRYCLGFAVTCFYFYIFWAIAPKCLRNSRVCLVILVGVILLCWVLMIYSWATEWEKYARYFDPNVETFFEPCIVSFSGNRNVFGATLLFGIVSLGILQSRRHCWIHYVMMTVFAAEEVFIFSKTCLIILAFYLPAFGIYRFLAAVRYQPIRSCVCLSIALNVCIGIAAIWIASVNLWDGTFFEKLGEMLMGTVFTNQHETMDSRKDIWAFMVAQLNSPLRIVFGLGETNTQWFLGAWAWNGGFGFIHNGFLSQLVTGGVLRSLIYLILIGYVIYLYVRGYIRHRRGTTAFLLGFLAMNVHALTETTSFLETDGKGILLSFVLILPFLVEQRRAVSEEEAAQPREVQRLARPFSYAFLGASFLPLAVCVLLYIARINGWGLIPIFVAFGCVIILIPLVLVLSCLIEKKRFLRGYFLLCEVFMLLSGGCLALAYFLPTVQIASNIALLSIFCLVCYFLSMASCRRLLDLSSLRERQEKIEDYFATHSPRWFTKGQRREDRYFSKQ